MSSRVEESRKAQVARFFQRLAQLRDAGTTIEDWNRAFTPVVTEILHQLTYKFGNHETGLQVSAAASAVRTVGRLVQDGPDDATLPPQRSGPEGIIGVLVLIALDKFYKKKQRDSVDLIASSGASNEGDERQEELIAEAMQNEIQQRWEILLNQLGLLGGGQTTKVYILLLEKELGIRKLSYQAIAEEAGCSNYSVRMARESIDQFGAGLKEEARQAVANLNRRLRSGA